MKLVEITSLAGIWHMAHGGADDAVLFDSHSPSGPHAGTVIVDQLIELDMSTEQA